MQKHAGLLTAFFVFFLLSIILLFLFRRQAIPVLGDGLDRILLPVQQTLYGAFSGVTSGTGETDRVKKLNRELAKKLVDQSELIKEVNALRDQYEKNTVSTSRLLPSRVIGMKSFIPGASLPETIIVDKGEAHGVRKGQVAVVDDTVIGHVGEITESRSEILLITNTKQSLTAHTLKTNAIGILKGKGDGGMTLENVVLSEKLENGDLVVTKGDQTIGGMGYPPGLVIGKITSVDKKVSDLFQTAEVESLVKFVDLTTVFIISD